MESITISQVSPTIIPESEHGISCHHISENAHKVLHRLNKAGYDAYLVGGAVRDLLLGYQPKDFDVATSARPEEIRRLFKNCRLIGRRFRLAHIRYGREVIEVATFRAAHGNASGNRAQRTRDGRILRDNVYGDINDDVMRRDLTVNSLFYRIRDCSVIDYVNGMADIQSHHIRIIGDPETRYREDPVRMLRVLRFVAKLSFKMNVETVRPIQKLAFMLDDMSAARLFDEVLKFFQKGHALRSFKVLREYGLFSYLFLQVEDSLEADNDAYIERFIRLGLENTDRRIHSGKSVNPAYLYAFLLWGCLQQAMRQEAHGDMSDTVSMNRIAREIFAAQVEQTAIPKRYSVQSREIWILQSRFEQRRGKRPMRLLNHPRFRAAYDFLLLRNQCGENLQELCEWWAGFQEMDDVKRVAVSRAGEANKRPRRHPL